MEKQNQLIFSPTKRTVRDPFEVHRSENHHLAIIDSYRFEQVQKLKEKRSNIEVDGHGNRVRKNTHYSTKHPQKAVRMITKPLNE